MNNDYQITLNIPSTIFPMRANLTKKEPLILQYWENIHLYKILSNGKKRNFIIYDGPPYANGKIHLGHALNKILKDIINKYKITKGYKIQFIPGWDCHGLPIETQVKKQISKTTTHNNIQKNEFIQICKNYVKEQINIQKKDFCRLGILANWMNYYTTMGTLFKQNIIDTFYNILKKKQLKYELKSTFWCTVCKSVIAESEIQYKQTTSPSLFITLKIKNKENILKLFLNNQKTIEKLVNVFIIIWTTTPWTIPECNAVAINEEAEYILIVYKKNTYIIAKEAHKQFNYNLNIKTKKIGNSCLGKRFLYKKLQHPLYKKIIPIITDKNIKINIGTGCVHIAPAHGSYDFYLGKKYNLSIKNCVDESGYYTKYIKNVHYTKIKKILTILKKKKKIFHYTKIIHSYPYCWRHNNTLIHRATKQLFLSIEKNNLRTNIIKNINNKIKWIPSWTKETMLSMIENRPNWCISRQRTWGVPIPLFVNKLTKNIYPKTNGQIKKINNYLKKNGIDTWNHLDSSKILQKKNVKNYVKQTDILDVWFDSGTVPLYLQKKVFMKKAHLFIEGIDQHRGWFQTTIILSILKNNQAPCREILSHGFVVDSNGKKMSKSIGNLITPNEIIEKYGADILRLWVASSDYFKDIQISYEIIKQNIEIYRKIRNTLKFILGNLFDYDFKKNTNSYENLLYLDDYMLYETQIVQKKIDYYYKKYTLHKVIKVIYNYCNDYLSSFYFDILKDRLYTCKKISNQRISAQKTLYSIMLYILIWISPIISFTAEEAFFNLKKINKEIKEQTVFLLDKKKLPCYFKNNKLTRKKIFYLRFLKNIKKEINKEINNLIISKQILNSLDVELEIHTTKKILEKLDQYGTELKFIFLVSTCNIFLYKKKTSTSINLKKTNIKNVLILLKKTKKFKCIRCWHRINEIQETICNRCFHNLQQNNGECRLYF